MTNPTPMSPFNPVNDEFSAAFAREDFDGVAATYTEDARLLPPGGPLTQGRASIAEFWQGVHQSGVRSVSLETTELTEAGAVAYEIGRAHLGDGSTAIQTVKYVVVWRRTTDGWRWEVDIWNTQD